MTNIFRQPFGDVVAGIDGVIELGTDDELAVISGVAGADVDNEVDVVVARTCFRFRNVLKNFCEFF